MGRPPGSKNKPKEPPSIPSSQRDDTPLRSITDPGNLSQDTPAPPASQPPSSQPPKKRKLPDFDRDGTAILPTSQELVLRWLESNPDNVKRLYGGTAHKSTLTVAGEISRYLVDNGGQHERSAESIHAKINSWKRQWNEARDYQEQTGAGGGARKLLDAEEEGDDDAYNRALLEVEADKYSKCPMWDRLDPIFWELGGVDSSLKGDSAQDSNPTLMSLKNMLRTPNRATPATPATPTPLPTSQRRRGTSTASQNRATVRTASWSNFGDESPSDITVASKLRKEQGSVKRLVENDDEYRQIKKKRMLVQERRDRENATIMRESEIMKIAEIINRNSVDKDWDQCVLEAERRIQRRIEESQRRYEDDDSS